MVRMSVLADALHNITSSEKAGNRQVMIRPCSRVIIRFLEVMQQHGYIGEFDVIDDHRAQKVVVQLIGRVNKCKIISPQFSVAVEEIENWVNSVLPSRQFGYLVLTTSEGIVDHEEARKLHVGGKALGFFY
eukprot:TRINITY_DN30336_c0_g1_i1.p2 TRINITY_DN30336_c0_g1~~TRINITY_DN30336_c0_g1_i1.p2  ORF type:complete len:131 (-),score=5.16 TRINITY_DN30336_c0_g1_i1:55-447(-)